MLILQKDEDNIIQFIFYIKMHETQLKKFLLSNKQKAPTIAKFIVF